MRISIIFAVSPLKAYLDNKAAIREYERLRDLDDYVDYSLMELSVEDAPPNKPVEPTGEVEPVLINGHEKHCSYPLTNCECD